MGLLSKKEMEDVKRAVDEGMWQSQGVDIDFQRRIKGLALSELMMLKALGTVASGRKPEYLDLYVQLKSLEAEKSKTFWTTYRSWSALGISIISIIVTVWGS